MVKIGPLFAVPFLTALSLLAPAAVAATTATGTRTPSILIVGTYPSEQAAAQDAAKRRTGWFAYVTDLPAGNPDPITAKRYHNWVMILTETPLDRLLVKPGTRPPADINIVGSFEGRPQALQFARAQWAQGWVPNLCNIQGKWVVIVSRKGLQAIQPGI